MFFPSCVRLYRMNLTETFWTACWTWPGSAHPLIAVVTGHQRWEPVRFPLQLWSLVKRALLTIYLKKIYNFSSKNRCHKCIPFFSSPGVNVPDHDMTFQSLSELLQQSVTPHVASVQANECASKFLLLHCVIVTFITVIFSSLVDVFFVHNSTKALDEEGAREVDRCSCGWGGRRGGGDWADECTAAQECALLLQYTLWLVQHENQGETLGHDMCSNVFFIIILLNIWVSSLKCPSMSVAYCVCCVVEIQ